MRAGLALIALAALGACSLEPRYVRPIPAVPAGWPMNSPELRASEAGLTTVRYQDIFRDPRLQSIIARALANNQDLKLAAANIETARGLYRVQRAALLPSVDANAGLSVRNGSTNGNGFGVGPGAGGVIIPGGGVGGGGVGGGGGATTIYNANVGAAFEIDLFGRLRSLSRAALDQYFATEAAARATRLALVADLAQAYLTLATDRSLIAIARDTAASAQRSVTLTQARLRGGVAPRTDLRQAETVLATAQSDLASLTTIVQQDRNAIDLLVGQPITDADLPPSIEEVEAQVMPLSAGIDSSVLLRRPDVVEAEFRLRAANAQIGAARAAFFPRLSLTGLAGFASTALTSLFSGGAFNWSVAPSATVPIFDGGANRGNLTVARGQAAAAEATYQRTIQIAFRDVADALARRATIADQASAQLRLEAAARDTAFLTNARYKGGVATFLESLDAQRSLYSARRSLASTRLVRATSLVDLYRSLGGDQLDPATTLSTP